jgi:hypothetical protein
MLKQAHVAKLVLAAVLSLLIAHVARAADEKKPDAKPAEQAKGAEKPSAEPTPYGLTKVSPFTESTTVQGKLPSIQGVWLLVARPQIVPGKEQNFVQLLKITGKEEAPEFHMLDVRLPPEVEKVVKETNIKREGWKPDEKSLGTLASSWQKLPKYDAKGVGEFIFDKVTFEASAADQFDNAFGKRTDELNNMMKDSTFAVQVTENYLPHTLPPDAKVAQIMQRRTVYLAKSVAKDSIAGDAAMGFLTAGAAGSPLPMQFKGTFSMYRLGPAS